MSIFDELARMGGYHNSRDMFDGGGAMARGGRFQGGGLLSLLGNLANSISGRDMGERSAYFAKKPMQRPMPMQNNAPQRVNNPMAPTSPFDAERMMAINNPIGNSFLARQDNPSGIGYGMANAPINSVADVDSPINTAKVTPQQSQIEELATNIVADEMGVGFFTAPLVERQRLVQNKINELTIAMGIGDTVSNNSAIKNTQQVDSIAPKANEVFNVLDFANKIAQPGFVKGSLFGGFDYLDTDYNRLDPYAARENYLKSFE